MPISKRQNTPGRNAKKKLTGGRFNHRMAEWWERGKKLAGMRLCRRCRAVYFDGHWHTAPSLAAAIKAGRKKATEDLCLECRFAVEGPAGVARFGGQATFDGLKDPDLKSKLLAAVRAFGRRIALRDPEHRILSIDDRGARVVVLTSENQMAVGLAKAIDRAFKGGSLRVAWSEDDLPARVYWKSGE